MPSLSQELGEVLLSECSAQSRQSESESCSSCPHCCYSTFYLDFRKKERKKTAAELSSFGLQMLVGKAELAAAPQVRGYWAQELMLLGLETPPDSPAWAGVK